MILHCKQPLSVYSELKYCTNNLIANNKINDKIIDLLISKKITCNNLLNICIEKYVLKKNVAS